METFISDDGSVGKFIHNDGSETAVKVVKSCSNFHDPETGIIATEWVDRNKYSVFISSSLGCYMACGFCHLTIKGSQYRKLDTASVVANVKEALLFELARKPEMKERYVKLCWMGMGDAVNQPDMVYEATLLLMEWIMANGYAKGLDCVDLSTVLPKVGDSWIERFHALNEALKVYPMNPESFKVEQAEVSTHDHYEGRTPFRMFYSVHSAKQETRDKMVPRALPVAQAVELLKRFRTPGGPNLMLHQLFIEDLNDSEDEVTALLHLLKQEFPGIELRILRYNFCDRSPHREWSNIDYAISRLPASIRRSKCKHRRAKKWRPHAGSSWSPIQSL